MSKLDAAIRAILTAPGGAMKDRLISEIQYARRVSDALNGKHAPLVLGAAEAVAAAVKDEGALTDARALEIEQTLLPMQEDCKKYRLLLCGHAHIDMNWMWRYDETVQITLDTFRTALELMDEFPQFKFSQSQASVYRIVEEFAPQMLPRIAEKVKSGQWEVSATTWVEADRNMPSAESVARHHLYTKRYLPKLLGVPESAIPPFDFEPDTFGHNRNTPEMLHQAGVKYYYHCRGFADHTAYRWRAPSGAEIIVYREPYWYLGAIDSNVAEYVPEFCEQHGMTTAMRVYGVGDHGGGPTRRDIERIIDMGGWPIFPRVEFGFYNQFYAELEAAKDRLPVVDKELNAVFVGCYTTQTRIKKGNRYGERLLSEAEGWNALANRALNVPYRREKFEEGWRNVLFNQFHDILPGSGVQDTREHAMALYQQAYAVANSAKWASLNAIAEQIDTTGIAAEFGAGETAEGAGVGFRVEESIDLAPVGRGGGANRVFHLFNSLPYDRKEVAELTVWDYTVKRVQVTDANGNPVRHQLITAGRNAYWGHNFVRLLIEAEVPALGYASYAVTPEADYDEPYSMSRDPRVEVDEDWVLENEIIRLECDPAQSAGGLWLTDKRDGREYYIDGFSLVEEDPARGMTAWTTGDPLGEPQGMKDLSMKRSVKGELYNELSVTARFGGNSKLAYTIGLYAGGDQIVIGGDCDFLEVGDKERLPQLRFDATDSEMTSDQYIYDIPGGLLRREAAAMDLPGLRFIAGEHLALMTDSKYGYQGNDGTLGATLIRNSTDPDHYPELGKQRFKLSIALCEADGDVGLTRRAQRFLSPLTAISGRKHAGSLPAVSSMMRLVSGSVEINSVKLAEEGEALVIRGVELIGDGADVRIDFMKPVKTARFADTHEQPVDGAVRAEGNAVCFDARKYGMFTLLVEF